MATRIIPSHKQALADAAVHCGGQVKLGDALSSATQRRVSQQWISRVINGPQNIPAEWCLPLERLTGGKWTRHDFRPDLYPHENVPSGRRATA